MDVHEKGIEAWKRLRRSLDEERARLKKEAARLRDVAAVRRYLIAEREAARLRIEEADRRNSMVNELSLRAAKAISVAAGLPDGAIQFLDSAANHRTPPESIEAIASLLFMKMPPEPVCQVRDATKEPFLSMMSVVGNYFLWSSGEVVYTGISKKIAKRITSASHEGVRDGDEVSFVPTATIEEARRNEHLYIWLLNPVRNRT